MNPFNSSVEIMTNVIRDIADMLEADEKIISKEAIKPCKIEDWYRGDKYLCPLCGREVAGYTNGASQDDWGYHEDKFCSRCGAKMLWEDK